MSALAGVCAAALLVTGTGAVTAFAEETAVPVAATNTTTQTPPQGTAAADCMQKVYENLMKEGSSYRQYKEIDASTTFTETFENNKLTIKVESEETNGTWEYALDGNYIVTTWKEGEYTAAVLLGYVTDALSELLGMDEDLVTGFVNGVYVKQLDDPYFNVKTDESTKFTTVKMFAGGAWDMQPMESWAIDEEYMKDYGPLEEDDKNVIVSIGKLHLYVFGNKDSVDIILSEHGGKTQLIYQSLINAMNVFAPVGYEDFLKEYTELREAEGKTWKVSFIQQEEAPEIFGELDGDHEYLKLHIEGPAFEEGKNMYLEAGDQQTLTVKHGTAKSWKSSKTAVATVKNGKVTGLKKGSAKVTATLEDGSEITCNVKVMDDPSLTIGGKAFSKSKTYSIKKGSSLTVKISGKASSVKNSYASSKKTVAKVTSKATAKSVKIKGVKKGSAKITIKVNGVAFKVKVKVA